MSAETLTDSALLEKIDAAIARREALVVAGYGVRSMRRDTADRLIWLASEAVDELIAEARKRGLID